MAEAPSAHCSSAARSDHQGDFPALQQFSTPFTVQPPLLRWKRSPSSETGRCPLLLLTACSLLVALQRGWYQTENEYYLLQFTLTVRCLYYTSFSLEFCWQQLPAGRTFYSLPWMMAYVFYYPVFHNGPILSFPEFVGQVRPWGRD